MNKELLENYLNQGISLQKIAKLENKAFATIQYWVKKYELKSAYINFKEQGKKDYGTHRVCPKCRESKEITEFYSKRGKEHASTYCRECSRLQVLERVRLFKTQIIAYKGGKCEQCGYDKYQGALEFHHLDPTKKDFSLSQVKTKGLTESIKKELDKCILVCANCHREIHNSFFE